uniref:Cytoplasmic FMR1-interacting protein n=1 Tax=Trichuris muris TaxID=70415 RepID=A0A5S6QGB0_TRIMR
MSSEVISFSAAVGNVELLEEISLPDGQPMIEAQPRLMQYTANFDTNFEDRGAFITGISKYIEEASRHAELKELLMEGERHAVNLYTWRCCSRAVPMAKSNEQPNRAEIYDTIVEVLQPEVKKLLQFMYFQVRATRRFCEEVKRLSHCEKRKDFVSEVYLITLGKMISMFAVLDELKNMKASIKNDYSTYRRATQFLQVMSDSQTLQESQNLSMFLATQNKIKDSLRAQLQEIDGYDELLADVVNVCVNYFDNRRYITPAEKHMLIKVIGFGICLIDDSTGNLVKLDQRKRISISRLDRILKQHEVVPLFGDMQVIPFAFIKRSQTFDPTKWPQSSVESVVCPINIVERARAFREEHGDFVTRLAAIRNRILLHGSDAVISIEEGKELTDMALQGLQLLSSWTSCVVEVYAWKLLHPTDPHQNRDCPADAEEYERATRYNYSSDEKVALIEMISMIKGLQVLMAKMETDFVTSIQRTIYVVSQELVQVTLREPLRKATKNKKELIRTILQSVRDTMADVSSFHEVDDIYGKYRKDAMTSSSEIQISVRSVAPSFTQLYMVRTMLESLVSDRSGGKKFRKDLEEQHAVAINNFLKQSVFWVPLLQFNEFLDNCCDLSQLWFREFYLEMTMGKNIQFPIEMSMPWILTDHILESRNPALIESALYQLDLYNDSAQCALVRFRKQFLYDEVEAEVNLGFDQFVCKLSHKIFAHYKQLASSILLDKRFKADCSSQGMCIPFVFNTRYATLMKQRHFQLLGRSVDLNRLLTQRINVAILKSLDLAINHFEANSITEIVALEGLIMVNRLCHQLLKQHLPGLTDFVELFQEANHSVSAPYGRITLHVFWELNYDFLLSYCYNGATNRFVRTKASSATSSVQRDNPPQAAASYFWGSKDFNSAFSNLYAMYSGFLGAPHFHSLARLLKYQGIAVVMEELLKVSGNLLQNSILNALRKVVTLVPKVCKLPRYDYGSPGVVSFYYAQLKRLVCNSDLQRDIFQSCRELGNMILFCLHLEKALTHEEVTDLVQSNAFIGNLPRPFCKASENPDIKIKRLEQKYANLQVARTVERYGTEKQVSLAQEGELLTRERLCCGLSIFEVLLTRMKNYLVDPIWFGSTPPSNSVMYIDECVEFHRLWSALQFVFCIPTRENQISIEEIYGEGLNWCGCALVAMLDQRRRFEVVDFCYHILRVFKVDGKDDNVPGVGQLSRMIERIRQFQLLNSTIFGVLCKYLKYGGLNSFVPLEKVQVFHPPAKNMHMQ